MSPELSVSDILIVKKEKGRNTVRVAGDVIRIKNGSSKERCVLRIVDDRPRLEAVILPTGKNSKVHRLLRRPVSEDNLSELHEVLMETAEKTGGRLYFDSELKSEIEGKIEERLGRTWKPDPEKAQASWTVLEGDLSRRGSMNDIVSNRHV